MVMLAWVFFRAADLMQAINYLLGIVSFNSFSVSLFTGTSKMLLFSLIIVLAVLTMLFFEYRAFRKTRAEVNLNFLTTLLVFLMILLFGVFKNPSDFIYFQF
jgi:uncharacterized membrane protein SirB2